MSQHPANQLLRFVLEVITLIAIGEQAWLRASGAELAPVFRYLYAIAAPLLIAVLWLIFTVPGDPGLRSPVRVTVPGGLRLGFELVVFSLGIWSLVVTGQVALAIVVGFALLLHIIWSLDRIFWLLHH